MYLSLCLVSYRYKYSSKKPYEQAIFEHFVDPAQNYDKEDEYHAEDHSKKETTEKIEKGSLLITLVVRTSESCRSKSISSWWG
jgi:hypothetical protein